jgi:hypothetical protein
MLKSRFGVHCAKEEKDKDKKDKKETTEKGAKKRPCEGEASSSKGPDKDHLMFFAAPTPDPRKAPFSRQPLAAPAVEAPCGSGRAIGEPPHL